jgi:hypothetical protein
MKYLITGLESSCTKIIARTIALNLNIIKDIKDWDGHEQISNDHNLVVHRSLPHGNLTRDNFISSSYASEFDYIVISIRDWNCSLESKIKTHQPDSKKAEQEHDDGVKHIKDIYINNIDKVYLFSYETAFIMQDLYLINFMKNIGIQNYTHVPFTNINKKYIIGKENTGE